MATIKDQFVGRLVNKLTGLKANTPEWNKTVQKVKYMLTYEKCASTSEYEVKKSIDGLVERFAIKGHKSLSKALKEHETEFLKTSRTIGSAEANQSILKFDMLRLLLSLSSSENQTYDYIPKINEIEEEKTLTWDEILKDDPLQGDHWEAWHEESSIDNVSDDDGYELEEEMTPFRQSEPLHSREATNDSEPRTTSYIDQMDIDDRADPKTLENLITQQYWRTDYKLPPEDTTEINLLQKPCQLNDAINQLHYSETDRRQFKSVPESAIIREVIFMLKGHSGVLYQYVDGQYKLNENYVIQHLSQEGLRSILNEFCEFSNILSELRQIVTHVANSIKYGQTSQAFASCILKSLQDFNVLLAGFEADTGFITQNESQIISVSVLRNSLDTSLHQFKEIHDIAMNIPFDQEDPRLIATYLIAMFYDRSVICQNSQRIAIYDTLLYVLEQLIVPYGRMIDEWIFYGSLEGDIANEFYVSRKENVSINEPNFWIDGFFIQPIVLENISYQCPLFSPKVMSRIFFTGKAVNLLLHIESTLKNVRLLSQIPAPFLALMNNFLVMKSPFINSNRQQVLNRNTDSVLDLLFSDNQQQPEQIEIDQPVVDDVECLFHQDFIQFIEKYIQEPYLYTANVLNNTLHKNCRLLEQLKSLASIYLMLENNLMHSFCHALFKQIDNNEPWFDKRILNSIFSDACQTNGYDEIVYIQLSQNEEIYQPKIVASYLDLIEFEVQIPWPLNNFIQTHHLESYYKIFRLLLRLKRAKYVMENNTLFRDRLDHKKSSATDMKYYSIRMRLLWFINSFWRYILTTILHTETIEFRNRLSISKDVDEITELHASYIDKIVDKCLLNDKCISIKKSIISIFDMAEQMANMFNNYMDTSESKTKDVEKFNALMDSVDKDFTRTNEFVSVSLMILGKKANLPWFESLASSLSTR